MSRRLVILGGVGCFVVVAISIALASKRRADKVDRDHPEKASDETESKNESVGTKQRDLPVREAAEDSSNFALLETKENSGHNEPVAFPERLTTEILHPVDEDNEIQAHRSSAEQQRDDESRSKEDVTSHPVPSLKNDNTNHPAAQHDSELPDLNGDKVAVPIVDVDQDKSSEQPSHAADAYEIRDRAKSIKSLELRPPNVEEPMPPQQNVAHNCNLQDVDQSLTLREQENHQNQSNGTDHTSPKRRRHRKKKKGTEPAGLDTNLEHSEGGDCVDLTPTDGSSVDVTELLKAKTKKVRNHQKSGAAAVAVKELQSAHVETSKKKKKRKGKSLP